MAKTSSAPKAITANRLQDGEVVYLAASGVWSTSFADAVIAVDASDIKTLLDTASSSAHRNEVVDPVAIDTAVNDCPSPASLREKIRLRGPTVRPDLARI
jgi:hypothetical protein